MSGVCLRRHASTCSLRSALVRESSAFGVVHGVMLRDATMRLLCDVAHVVQINMIGV